MKGGISNGSRTVVVHMFQNLDPVIRLQGQVTGVSGSIRIESRSRGQGRRCLSVSRGRYRWAGILLSRGRCLLVQCGIGKLVRRRGIRCRGRVRRRRRLNRLPDRGRWLLDWNRDRSWSWLWGLLLPRYTLGRQLSQNRRQLLRVDHRRLAKKFEFLNKPEVSMGFLFNARIIR